MEGPYVREMRNMSTGHKMGGKSSKHTSGNASGAKSPNKFTESRSNKAGGSKPAKYQEGSKFIRAGGNLDGELRPLGNKGMIPTKSWSIFRIFFSFKRVF